MILQDIRNPLVFSAFKNDRGSASSGEYIRNFNGFLTNYGNSFSLTSGIFTSPRQGVFEFSTAIHHYTRKYSNTLVIEKSNSKVLEFEAYAEPNNSNGDTLSFSWIIDINQGETIRLKVGNNGKFEAYADSNWVFNGKFIRN